MKPARTLVGVLTAVSALAHVEEKAEAPAAAYRAQVLAFLAQRQPEKATAFAMVALEYYPGDVEINLLFLDILDEEGLQDLGRTTYEELGTEHGKTPLLLYALGRLTETDDAAEKYYERAIAGDDKFAPARLGLATVALNKGDLAAAAREIDLALAADKRDRRAYAARGVLKHRQGDVTGALADFARALADEPYAPATHAAAAAAHRDAGDLAAAAEEYRRAVALTPSRGAYYFGLGEVLEATGETAAARLAYSAAAARAGDDAPLAAAAYGAAGRMALAAGETEEATELLRKAAALDATNAEAYYLLGQLYAAAGEPSNAAAFFHETVKLHPEDGATWYYLGVNLAAAGDLAGAELALARAEELLSQSGDTPTATAADAARELATVRGRRMAPAPQP